MVRADSLLGRLVSAARPGRPWLRLTLPPRWARLLVAAGARPVSARAAAAAPAARTAGRSAASGAVPGRDTVGSGILATAGQVLAAVRIHHPARASPEEHEPLVDRQVTPQVTVTLKKVEGDALELTAVVPHGAGGVEFHPVRVDADGVGTDYLLVTTGPPGGPHQGMLRLHPGAASTVRVAVFAAREASSLGTSDLPAVRRSVRVADRAGRDAWHRLADGRPADDPIRQAVLGEF